MKLHHDGRCYSLQSIPLARRRYCLRTSRTTCCITPIVHCTVQDFIALLGMVMDTVTRKSGGFKMVFSDTLDRPFKVVVMKMHCYKGCLGSLTEDT